MITKLKIDNEKNNYSYCIKYCFLLLLCLAVPLDAFAAVFEIIDSDLSKKYLGIVLGNQVGTISLGGSPNPVLQNMFSKLNAIVMSVGVTIISYISIVSTLNTAQEGEAMGKKWSSVWIPLRSILGMLLIVPSPASGYSLIQTIVIWIVLQGIGAANSIWDVILDGYVDGVGAANTTGYSELIKEIKSHVATDQLAKDVFNTAICMEGLKHIYAKRQDDDFSNGIAPSDFVNSLADRIVSYRSAYTNMQPIAVAGEGKYRASLSFGIRNSNVEGMQSICGKYQIYSEITKADDPRETGQIDPESEALRVLRFKQQGISAMLSRLTPVARSIVREKNKCLNEKCGYLRKKGYIDSAKEAYANLLSQLTMPANDDQRVDRINDSEKAKEHGWIHAGSYYRKLTSMIDNLKLYKTVRHHFPKEDTINGPTVPNAQTINSGEFTTMNETERDRLRDYFEMGSYYVKASGQKVQPVIAFGDGNTDTSGLFVLFQAFMTQSTSDFDELLTGDATKEPMAEIASFGGKLMKGAEITWISISLLSTIIAGVAGVFTSCLPNGLIFTTMLFTFITMIAGVLIMMWGVGATLGIYLPLVPYMIFTASAIGWVFLVIEAVVSAPIMAIGFMLPGGDELGKIAQGLMILTNIFLRPMLMLFGLVLSIRVFKVIILVINFGFFETVAENTNTTDSVFGFGQIFAMVIYASFIIASANKCFSLIHILPDKVMRWIGGSPEDSGAQQIMQETKGLSDSGQGAIHSSQKGFAEGAQKKSTDELGGLTDRGREEEKAKEKAKAAAAAAAAAKKKDQD